MSLRPHPTNIAILRRDMSLAAVRERVEAWRRDPACKLSDRQIKEDMAVMEAARKEDSDGQGA